MLGAASAATAEEVKAPAVDPAPEFDRAAWLADYDGLKATMARGYANLDWIVAHRGLDLAALVDETRGLVSMNSTASDPSAWVVNFGVSRLIDLTILPSFLVVNCCLIVRPSLRRRVTTALDRARRAGRRREG